MIRLWSICLLGALSVTGFGAGCGTSRAAPRLISVEMVKTAFAEKRIELIEELESGGIASLTSFHPFPRRLVVQVFPNVSSAVWSAANEKLVAGGKQQLPLSVKNVVAWLPPQPTSADHERILAALAILSRRKP